MTSANIPNQPLPETGHTGRHDIALIAERFGIDMDQVTDYIGPDEQLDGFGSGGSESLVMFVNTPTHGAVVRKVCSETLSAVPWDPKGMGVMAPPSTKGALQADYLQGLPDAVRPYFPQVHMIRVEQEPASGELKIQQKLVYDQSRLAGIEMSAFIAEEQPTPSVVAHLHHEVMRLLAEKVHPHRITPNNDDTIKESYLDKISARLELSRQAAPKTFGDLIDADHIMINGIPYRNITELLTFFNDPGVREMLEPQFHTLVMGDTNTENIIITDQDALRTALREAIPDFTYDDIGLKMIDPRAIGFRTAGRQTVDDPMYDNKPVHNSLGNYDMIHGEHFDISVSQAGNMPSIHIRESDENPYAQPYEGMEKYFDYIMEGWGVSTEEFRQRDPNWLPRFTFMMGSHFAAMPPFHFTKDASGEVREDPIAQKRAIAIYCEGIKWLNMAREMITGERKGLYNMPVGVIRPSNR